MMNWKRYFRELILNRGRVYYERQHVHDLTYRDGVYTAKVLGQAVYRVEIKIKNDALEYMKCSCPHAASGNYCKHMAAVMYAIDETNEELVQPQLEEETRVIPFTKKEDKYQYYDMERIAGDLSFPQSLYDDAKRLVDENKVILEKVEFGYQGYNYSTISCGVVYGHSTNETSYKKIKIVFSRDAILEAECGVYGCAGRYETTFYYSTKIICRHILALLLLLDGYLRKYNPGDSTNRNGMRFLSGFRNLHYQTAVSQQTEEIRDFALEPVLEKNRESIALSFKGGTDKLYVIKNLTEFVANYEDKDIIWFGQSTQIDLAKHRICPKDEEVISYVQDIVNEECDRTQHARIIHYDPWWNQAVQNQATDRAHRIGQTKHVSVYKLIVKNTIEEKIIKMQETKRDLADTILSGEMGRITKMSKEELMELLG